MIKGLSEAITFCMTKIKYAQNIDLLANDNDSLVIIYCGQTTSLYLYYHIFLARDLFFICYVSFYLLFLFFFLSCSLTANSFAKHVYFICLSLNRNSVNQYLNGLNTFTLVIASEQNILNSLSGHVGLFIAVYDSYKSYCLPVRILYDL